VPNVVLNSREKKPLGSVVRRGDGFHAPALRRNAGSGNLAGIDAAPELPRHSETQFRNFTLAIPRLLDSSSVQLRHLRKPSPIVYAIQVLGAREREFFRNNERRRRTIRRHSAAGAIITKLCQLMPDAPETPMSTSNVRSNAGRK